MLCPLFCEYETKTITYGVANRDAEVFVLAVLKSKNRIQKETNFLTPFIPFELDLNIEFDPMITRSLVSSYAHGTMELYCVKSNVTDTAAKIRAPPQVILGLCKSSANGR